MVAGLVAAGNFIIKLILVSAMLSKPLQIFVAGIINFLLTSMLSSVITFPSASSNGTLTFHISRFFAFTVSGALILFLMASLRCPMVLLSKMSTGKAASRGSSLMRHQIVMTAGADDDKD